MQKFGMGRGHNRAKILYLVLLKVRGLAWVAHATWHNCAKPYLPCFHASFRIVAQSAYANSGAA